MAGMRRKLGLATEDEGDARSAQDLLNAMAEARGRLHQDVPGTRSAKRRQGAAAVRRARQVRRLGRALARTPGARAAGRRGRRAAMQSVNPVYIPRNHRVEAVLAAAIERDDYGPFEEFLKVLARPFEERAEFADYAEPAPADQSVYRTFCGT